MESYVRIGRRGLKNLTYPYMEVGGVKNCQNHPYKPVTHVLCTFYGGKRPRTALDANLIRNV